jgi:hypothetical protein
MSIRLDYRQKMKLKYNFINHNITNGNNKRGEAIYLSFSDDLIFKYYFVSLIDYL